MPQEKVRPEIFREGESDNLEVISELDVFLDDPETSRQDNKYASQVPPRIQKLRDLRKKAKVSFQQGNKFLAGVELDITRKAENAMLLEELYIEWCNRGSRTWLSPLEIISKYDETLLFYQGKRNVLAPFIKNLRNLAREGISPHAFLRYVQNPRMGLDMNWREWEIKHLKALESISNVLLDLLKQPPFNKEILGTDFVKLARDIVLIKYVGRPLSRFSEDVLNGGNGIEEYKRAWSQLKLNNTAFIFFIKLNVLPLLYELSGKVEIQHINKILVILPDLEREFQDAFPEGYISITDPPGIYGNNFYKAFENRREKGYKYYDFVIEMESFLNIVSALLSTQSGFFVLNWFTNILIGRKNPTLAGQIGELIRIINDTGGAHIYIWHTKKLIDKKNEDRENYIELVRYNNGCDPEYPDIGRLFANPNENLEYNYLLNIASNLKIPLSNFGPPGTIITLKTILNAYIKLNPNVQSLLSQYQTEVIEGLDKSWDSEFIKKLDALGKSVYPLLIRMVIRGIGTNYFSGLKSKDFTELYNLFPVKHSLNDNVKIFFKIPYYEVKNLDKFKEEEIAKKVNRKLILNVLDPFLEESSISLDNFVPFLNEETTKLIESENSKLEEKKSLLLELENFENAEIKDSNQIKQKKDQIKKLEKSILFIQEKRIHYEDIMETFRLLNEHEKFLVVLFVSASFAEPDTDLFKFSIQTILQRYEKESILHEQLQFLRKDIVKETFNFTQVNLFIGTLELCRSLLQNDSKLKNIQEKIDHRLHELLKTYIVTKNKKLSNESQDASFHKLCAIGKILSEKAKWQDIIENSHKKVESSYSAYSIFLSKTTLDAYYGDMGGICLSHYPKEITKDGFQILRLISHDDSCIVGMGIVVHTVGGILSKGINEYLAVFGLNPLASIISSFSYRNQLFMYLQYRKVLEKISLEKKLPVALMGVDTHGILSNHGSFRDLILRYELNKKSQPAVRVEDAKGISLLYNESSFKEAIIIIDPKNPKTFTAEPSILMYQYPS